MKKLKKITFILLMLFIMPIFVNAEENKITMKAPTMASKGDEVIVDLVLTSEQATNEFKGTLTFESNVLELLNIESKDSWKLESKYSKESPATLNFTRENSITGEITIATLKFLIKNDSTSTNTTISIEGTSKNEDETINTLQKNSVSVDIKSTDNTIKSIKLNNELIDNFSSNVYSYKQIVDSSVVTASFGVELNDSTATFKAGFEPKTNASLDYGDNLFEIVVVSAAGQELKYTVTIVREDNRGTDNNLAELIVNSNKKLLNFKPSTLNYTVTTHKLETVDIYAEAKDSKATVKIDKPEKLVIGTNEVKIIVTSEKNEEKIYTIVINNSDKEIDTSLKSLEIFGLDEDIDFQKNVYDYEVLYKSKYKDSLIINPIVSNPEEAEVDKNTYENELANLTPGKKITIEVKAKDGTENVSSFYTITFKKDNRINFFLILGIIIFIVLLIIFIKLYLKNKKQKEEEILKEEELVKTKKLEKITKE